MATFSVAALTGKTNNKSKKKISEKDKKIVDKYSNITSAYENNEGKVVAKGKKPKEESKLSNKVNDEQNLPENDKMHENLQEEKILQSTLSKSNDSEIKTVGELQQSSDNLSKNEEKLAEAKDQVSDENISATDEQVSDEITNTTEEQIANEITNTTEEQIANKITNTTEEQIANEMAPATVVIEKEAAEKNPIETASVEKEVNEKEVAKKEVTEKEAVSKVDDIQEKASELQSEKLTEDQNIEDVIVESSPNTLSAKEEKSNVVNKEIAPEEEQHNVADYEVSQNVSINIEETAADINSPVEEQVLSQEEISNDEESNFVYGEADPDEFVYYHRKDIRLKFHTGEKRRQLLESIRANGIHEPILVRKGYNGKLEIIAGHNRQDIAKELGIKVPYILLKNLDDDTADQICVDTNLLNRQHSDMLPSELSNMLAVKRKMFTLEKLSEEFHIANTTMKAFLKLQDLLPELLYDWVDAKKIGMTVGYTIACADRKQQYDLLCYLKENSIKSISVKQGKELSNRGKQPWDKEFLDKLFRNEFSYENMKPQAKVSLTFKELGKYLDANDLKDPKESLYHALSLKKRAYSLLSQNNISYSEDVLMDALTMYIDHMKEI